MKVFKNHISGFSILIIALTMFSNSARTQLSESFFGIQGSAKYGFLIPHRSTMGHLVQGHASALELGVNFQMDGTRKWHHDFHLPSVGFVLSYSDFGFKEVLGKGVGVQISTYLPYFRRNGWSLGSLLGAGVGYSTKKFDQIENPKNNAIGSSLNALVTFGIKVEKQFNRSSLGLEVDMTHLSNGAYKLPNLGLNLPLVGLQFTHYLDDLNFSDKGLEVVDSLNKRKSRFTFFTQLIVSSKQIYPTGGANFGIVSLTNFTQFSRGGKSKLEAGLDLIYNQSIIRDVPGDYGAKKNFQAGLYMAYILDIHNVDFLLGMGRYVHNPLDPKGMWYHKLGARVRLTNRLSANIVIKAHWAKADYFEYGIAYRW